jgi:hypothetical protein
MPYNDVGRFKHKEGVNRMTRIWNEYGLFIVLYCWLLVRACIVWQDAHFNPLWEAFLGFNLCLSLAALYHLPQRRYEWARLWMPLIMRWISLWMGTSLVALPVIGIGFMVINPLLYSVSSETRFVIACALAAIVAMLRVAWAVFQYTQPMRKPAVASIVPTP